MNLDGARVFMTGGAGFIGSHLVRDLLGAGASVTVYDDFSSGLRENLEGVDGDLRIERGDILDYEQLRDAMRGHDAVSHQAAQLEITRSIGDPVYDLTTNTIGTIQVLKAATELGILKVVEASSAGVYGQAVTDPQTEEHPTEPNWEYGVSKLACEKYAAIYCERNPGLSIASLRYAIVYGEREWFGRVLTLFLERALRAEPPVVFGRGDQVRDFVYVGDITRLHRRCLEVGFSGHLVLNGSTGTGTTVMELARLVCEVTGIADGPAFEDVGEGERSALVGGRMRLPSELKAMQMANGAARRAVGWAPEVGLREGLEREWNWLEDHPHRWTEMSY
ncbi:MAG: NAD-dependent epimerase/dehydratase family protein [Acidimicrobiia bacterium]